MIDNITDGSITTSCRDEEPTYWTGGKNDTPAHGKFRLGARFEHPESGTEVRVMSSKTYQQPGFANAHRDVLVEPDEGYEEVAGGNGGRALRRRKIDSRLPNAGGRWGWSVREFK